MTTLTVEDAAVQLKALADAPITQLRSVDATTLLRIPEAEISLAPGEHYAGPVLGADGTVQHHLVLMAPRPDADLDWDAAMAWAAGIGGALPTRQEQALLFANCGPHLQRRWHWSGQQYEKNASSAWTCYFSHGLQFYDRKSSEGGAVAVRRLNP
jgi:hypothetical protein